MLFQPLRRRAQLAANRIVYGERATPYEVLSTFVDAMARTGSLEEQLDRMVALVAGGTGANRVEVWIRVGTYLRAVATWPSGSPIPPSIHAPDDDVSPPFEDATATADIRQDAETLGTIVVSKPKEEPLSPTEAALAEHVASQAGLVVRNVRLTAELRLTIHELRASRRRLVEAQNSETPEDRAEPARRRAATADRARRPARPARADLEGSRTSRDARRRDRAAQDGAPRRARRATRSRAWHLPAGAGRPRSRGCAWRSRSDALRRGWIGRYDQEVEAAVYFCALQALQNVSKYAAASSVAVRLTEWDGWLTFDIEDDGRGFDRDATRGPGLQWMADRLDAIGGSLDIESQPGVGTIVRGRVPVTTPSPVEGSIDQR